MEDHAIVALYWARDERALTETAAKFGAYCRKIAMNLLASPPDAEEVENDTWLAAWDSMPENRPARLAPYLGRITPQPGAGPAGPGPRRKSAAAGRRRFCWTSWPNACPRPTG